MSASQDKKRRQSDAAAGLDTKQSAREAAIRAKKKSRAIWTSVGVLLVLLIAVVIVLNSNLFYTTLPAVTVGDQNFTTAEYNYYYQSAYMSFCNANSQYLQYYFDTSKPLDEQKYDDDSTWADFFSKSAIENLRKITMLCDRAEEAGYTLSEESQKEVDDFMTSLETNAKEAGYPNVKGFVAANYGQGCTEELVRRELTRSYLATEYSQHVNDSFSYTPDELESYYQDNRNSLDNISYSFIFLSGTADEENNIDQNTAMETARKTAEQIVSTAKDKASFEKNVNEITGQDAISGNAFASTVSSYGFGSWLLEDDRTPGEAKAICVEDTGYYAVIFLGRDDNHYNMAKTRQILITAELLEDGGITQENVNTAKEKAQKLLDDWKAGDATEESFAALAEENSEDSGSNTNGGLYETVIKGQISDEFDAFCFGEDTKPGDTAIVFTETDDYVGYIILYYVGVGAQYSDHLADLGLREEDYNAWETEQLESYPASTHFALRFGK